MNQSEINDVFRGGTIKPVPVAKKRREYKPIMVRIGVWTCLITITACSVYAAGQSLIHLNSSTKQVEAPKPMFHVENTLGPSQFARSFAYFWLLGDKTATNFLASGFKLPDDSFQPIKKRQVEGVEVWGVDQKGENQVNVLIRARIKVDGNKNDQYVYLSVPVVMEPGGKYGVYGIPTFVPDPGTAKAPDENLSGSLVDSQTENKVRFVVDSFFRFYTQGDSKDLSLLFEDGNPRVTLTGNYLGLKDLEIYKQADDQLLVNATAWIEINGIKLLQNYKFVFVKKGDEWRIRSTDPVIPE